jgi:hypothetical protein
VRTALSDADPLVREAAAVPALEELRKMPRGRWAAEEAMKKIRG